MIRINLLPREEVATKRRLTLPDLSTFAPLVLVVVAIGAISVMSLYKGQQIKNLEETIAAEEEETRRLAPEIAKIKRLDEQRASLNQRLEVIGDLDRDRYFRVHLLDELNRALPDHLWLTRFEAKGGDRYAVEGVTFSNFQVSDLIQNMNRSPYFRGVNLDIAERGEIGEVRVVKFKLQTSALRNPDPTALGG